MPRHDADRDVLFGVLALQADFLDAAQFAQAYAAWADRRDAPLADLLVERGWLTPEERAAVEGRLERQLQQHANRAPEENDDVRPALGPLDDPTVKDSRAGTPPDGQPRAAPAPSDPRQRYTRTRLHAQGGIGQIWVTRDEHLGRDVALKELRPDRADPAVRARFVAEAQITGQLEHPGIVPVYDLGEGAGPPFYTMRFVGGRTLSDAIKGYHARRQKGQASRLELRDLLNTFVGVCNAVAYAHSRGVIHRDLKPQNVVLGDFGEVVVLDWGLAKLTSAPDGIADPPPVAVPADAARQQTMHGQVLGTPGYMAPEQAEGKLDRVGPGSDIYGLGAVLYELLTGQPPFAGPDAFAVLRRVAREAPVPPRQRAAGVARALEAVCLKALAREPEDRYASAKELGDEVKRWLADEPVGAYRERWPERAARWLRARDRRGIPHLVQVQFFSLAAITVPFMLFLIYHFHHTAGIMQGAQEEAGRLSQRAAVAEEALGRTATPGSLYQAARVYAQASLFKGVVDSRLADELGAKAVTLLEGAVALGYDDVAQLEQDPELDPLWGREDFQRLLRELERKAPGKKPSRRGMPDE
jgi:serine/threonine-protein kinase